MKRMKLIGIGTKPEFDHETCEVISALFYIDVEQDFGDKKRIGITMKMSPTTLTIVPSLKSHELETYAKMFEKRTIASLVQIGRSYGEFENIYEIADVVRLKTPLLIRKAAGFHTFHQNMKDGYIVDSEQFFKDASELSKCKDGIIDKIITGS